ncbi:MAG: DUF3107 domain-containing protein [Actinomycetaceae bacterium]|nr:DUF3107 domain-containing protein [Actinomycetaceae bacterium]
MNVNISIRGSQREYQLKLDTTPEQLEQQVKQALKSEDPLTLTSTDGRTVIVPPRALGGIEIVKTEVRKVGFGLM